MTSTAAWLSDRGRYAGKLLQAFQPAHPVESLEMLRMFRRVRRYTGVDVPRLKTLWVLTRLVERRGIPGDIVECGVWNGGTSALMAFASRRSARPVWLFDSFEGFPEPTERDRPGTGIAVGDWQGSLSRVQQVLAEVGIASSRLRIRPGWFHETFPANRVEQIALLHIDADLYESVKLSLETFYDRVAPGGFIVLDDYGYWPGCRDAVDEFTQARGIRARLHVSDATGRWFQKPAG